MKRSSKELKQIARDALIGSYGLFALCFLIYFLIAFAVQMITIPFANTTGTDNFWGIFIFLEIASLILSLLLGILIAGFQRVGLKISRGEPAKVSDLFYGFRHHPDRFIVVNFLLVLISIAITIPAILLTVAITLGSISVFSGGFAIAAIILVFLIFIVLAYLATLPFALAIILLIDNPDLGAIEAMKTSSHLMKGNKGRYFYLNLSFLGIDCLVLLSLGIGSLWSVPYQTVTYIEFYREVIGELDDGPRETNFDSYQPYDTV